MSLLKDVIWNPAGFDDLKKYSQKNNEFLREAATVFFERAKLEQLYAEGLTKLATKSRKICGDTIGTLRKSWEEFATQTDLEASLHKTLSNDITDEVTKPLKAFAETQKEARKVAEHLVEKATKQLSDKRAKEQQAKKASFNKAKECENLTVQLETSRGKTMSDKDLSKLDTKCKKAEESVERCDKDYIGKVVDAERARLDLDSSIESAADTLQQLEEERIDYFKKSLSGFVRYLSDSTPKFDEYYRTLEDSVNKVDIPTDINVLVEQRGSPRQPAEQIVFSCYEEDHGNTMDDGRRKHALEQKRDKLSRTLTGEKKAKKGLSRLNSVYIDTPSFSTRESKKDVGSKLGQTKGVINLLQASIYRMNLSIAQLGSYGAPNHRLSSYISTRKDKQGMICCTLKVPLHLNGNDDENNVDDEEDDDIYTPPSDYNTSTYGVLTYPGHSEYEVDDDFDDIDEFDDDSADFAVQKEQQQEGRWNTEEHQYSSIDQCTADYEYTASEKDELTIKPGDVIKVMIRHDDGWWKGELNGKTGLFPASYVHEI